MTVHQTGYNFHPNDRVWYFDQTLSTFKEGSCYQVEIKLYKKPTSAIERKLTYLVAIDNSPTTLRATESELYLSTGSGLVLGPLTPIYFATYNFNPEQAVWVIDRIGNGVRYGTVYQTELKIHKETEVLSHIKTIYYVSFNDGNGTIIAKESDVFATSIEAWAALGIVIGPAPLPPEVTSLPGTLGPITVLKVNSDSEKLFKGTPVYLKSNGTIARSDNIDDRALTFLGFVYDDEIPVDGLGRIVTEGLLSNSTQNWNNVTLGAETMASSLVFYLNGLGTISSVVPTSGYQRVVGMGVSDTEIDIRILSPTGVGN